MKQLFLIDGHSLIFKMYYAFLRRPMINSKGMDTSILFGFTKYILELIAREQPTHLAIAFDPPGKTFRHESYPDYKGTRSETPQLVIDALEPLTEICSALEIPVLMKPGFEADDVIGSFAKKAEKDGFDVYMVTVDKDYGQLLSEHIFQYKPGKSGSENEIFTDKDLCAKYGITSPEQFVDILAIWGDTADNVPGIRGIGEVGAGKLIAEWGSIEGIYQNLDKLKPKQREAFESSKEKLEMSRMLVTIKTDIPSDVSEDDLQITCRCTAKAAELFDHYEFHSLKGMLAADDSACAPQANYIDAKECGLDEFLGYFTKTGLCGISMTGNGEMVACCEDWEENMYFHIFRTPLCGNAEGRQFAETLNGELSVCGYNLKDFTKEIIRCGMQQRPRLFDIEIMHYIINPELGHKIEMLSQSYLGLNIGNCTVQGWEEQPEKTEMQPQEPDLFSSAEGQEDEIRTSARDIAEAVISYKLSTPIIDKLSEEAIFRVYTQYEEPLIEVLAAMENEGVGIDIAQLQTYRTKLEKEQMQLEAEIREICGKPSLNISSPKQLGTIIYEELNLNPGFKKGNKKSYPTDEETLRSLPVQHPIIEKILSYRGIKKLISTYIDPLPEFAENGKIHPTFNQALTATGRLSCSKPNLQNIPIRSEEGREIRRAFIPSDPEGFILSADYSQIELRIMAHFSNDPHMIEAFNEGRDIHTMTAAKIFNVSEAEVTADQRRMAKTANFGIIYGISAFGLSQRLGIPRQEAKKLIDDYFANFPEVWKYISNCISSTAEKGYAQTISGRRRYLPDITSRNNTVRSLAERNAVNAPIQGTAADIIKLAMIRIYKRLKEDGYRSRMILQIHDELVFDVVPGEETRLAEMVGREMEAVAKLSVSLTAECNWAKNLLDAH